jgi:hypothetical protein
MSNSESIFFSKEELEEFESWLDLKYDVVTWQGKYEKEFQTFWSTFFSSGQSLNQLIEKFEYAIINSKVGPLVNWFQWLKSNLICFSFITKEVSVEELAAQTNLSLREVSILLRDFFLDRLPFQEELLSESFQIVNIVSDGLDLTFHKLQEKLEVDVDYLKNSRPENVFCSMEVTLYPEWRQLVREIEKDFKGSHYDFKKLHSKISFQRQFKFFRDLVAILAVGFAIVWITLKININWERALFERISIYEPQLKWLNTKLTFKDQSEKGDSEFVLNPKDIDDVEEEDDNEFFEDEVRYDVESEVVLTSWDSLPKDFDTVEFEQSEYEELKKRGYRDTRYGHTKVYRVLMKSVDTNETKENLNELIQKYEATRVDNVKPGKRVPGGVYYNVFVPRLVLKEFMAQVMNLGDAVLYESRTRSGRNPPGKNKVFIWVKNI